MLQARRQGQPSDSSSEKSASANAYRRTSIPPIVASPSHSSLHSAHRAPLAPIDPQASRTIAEDQMSSSSQPASSSHGYPRPDSSKDRDRAAEVARYNIARPIINRTADDDTGSNQSSRRTSIPSYANMLPVRANPYPATRPPQRRPNHTPSGSSSGRRGSLPSIHLRQSSSTSSPVTIPAVAHATMSSPAHSRPTHISNEDLYSGLSSFTFGAAGSSRRVDPMESISPFSAPSDSTSADRTPRPSISGPFRRGYHAGLLSPSKPHSSQGKEPSESEGDEEEVARQSRAKMRAIDDGTRRPSLPTNSYTAGASAPSISTSPPISPSDKRSETSPSIASDRDQESFREDSDMDPDSYTLYEGESDSDGERHIVRKSRANHRLSAASQNTFGGGLDHYGYAMSEVDLGEGLEEPAVETPASFDGPRYNNPDPLSSFFPDSSRRGSQPWNIPGTSAGGMNRDREGSFATLQTGRRASRSVDDDLRGANLDTSTVHSTSQPESKADWRSLEIVQPQVQIQPPRDDPVDEQPPDEELNDNVYDGLNLDYILSGARSNDGNMRRSWSSGAPSYIQTSGTFDSRLSSGAGFPAWDAEFTGVRRPSTVTLGTMSSEDAFTRHVRRLDLNYDRRHVEWSFRRETADGSGGRLSPHTHVSANAEGTKMTTHSVQELWRQTFVGRFKVDIAILVSETPPRPPMQRINVRHIADPFSKGNIRGGPMAVIHKHSRAVAFSIFRRYSLFGRMQYHVHTSFSILLATKKVQEQFTSTRTTSKLSTHGLLEDKSRGGNTTQGTTLVGRETEVHNSRFERSKKGKDKEKNNDNDNDSKKSPEGNRSFGAISAYTSGTSSQTNSAGSVKTQVTDEAKGSSSRQSSPPFITKVQSKASSSTIAASHVPTDTVYSTMSTTSTTVHGSVDGPSTSYDYEHSNTGDRSSALLSHTNPSRSALRHDYMELDDDQSLPRTSHAEAFATLDSNGIDYMRSKTERPPEHDSASHNVSPLERWRRKLLGGTKNTPKPPVGSPAAAAEGHYTPPWMTMAPRSKQEERERVIQTLNESFKDVGLLPSFKNPKTHRPKKTPGKPNSAASIFAKVPADSLYMLLPLWPGETDAPSIVQGEDLSVYNTVVEQRQYLLVYYVAFDERKQKREADSNKKRSRGDPQNAPKTPTAIQSGKNIFLHTFRVCARVVSYNDFLGTGVRLPDKGLSVTGPMSEAMQLLPPHSIRNERLDDIVIGVCNGRHNGMEFLPEGLTKLGLCMPSTSLPPPQPIPETVEVEDKEVFLTPIGRAAVEMAWLGCMAVTSFPLDSTRTK